jgi:pilus assembly protein CpaF
MPRHPRLSNVAGVQQLFVARPSSAAPMASADLAPGRPIAEFGVLAPLIADPAVTDVFVNGGDGVFVDRGDGAVREKGVRLSAEDARALAVHLIALGGRHIDDATPCIDVRVAGGLRVHAVLPPLAVDGAVVSIRARRFESPTLDDLQRGGMFGPAQRSRLDDLVAHRRNVLIAGAAGSGNTTWHK